MWGVNVYNFISRCSHFWLNSLNINIIFVNVENFLLSTNCDIGSVYCIKTIIRKNVIPWVSVDKVRTDDIVV